MLPHSETLEKLLTSYFIIFKPRDIVSGDFYWITEIEGRMIITVADCTGHGVPGAFMSMLGIAFLREIVTKEYITHPGVILQRLRKEVIRALRQQGGDADSKDGMDITLCSIDKQSMNCEFAGANNSLLVIRKNDAGIPEIIELKADHMPVGYYEKMERFTMQDLQLQKGDRLFLFTDGVVDQFGGPKGKKLKTAAFKKILLSTSELTVAEQGEVIQNQISLWMNGHGHEYAQTDDITMLVLEM
jgi:serine phosphatase RsbU (regulator of sigma subunit)